jgi:hypothetical protein
VVRIYTRDARDEKIGFSQIEKRREIKRGDCRSGIDL